MKRNHLLIIPIALMSAMFMMFSSVQDISAAEKLSMKLYQEKYEMDFDNDFETVWNSILKSIQDIDCQTIRKTSRQTDQGLFKGIIQSDFCVFASGDDTTVTALKRYSAELRTPEDEGKIEPFPYILTGEWTAGRFQYKFIIEEVSAGKIHVKMIGELSGFENYVTKKMHFWTSNGILEARMTELIKSNIGKQPREE